MEDNKKCSLFPFSWNSFMQKNHQYSHILDYKLIFVRKQQGNLEKYRSSGQILHSLGLNGGL